MWIFLLSNLCKQDEATRRAVVQDNPILTDAQLAADIARALPPRASHAFGELCDALREWK